ncbi:hypothetical protein [Litorimonas sp. WD9-15]|uniref:hypothetical protein n=1 Tax=Litorimonas sp. WD9-15 TaxID=3418716 RepID=UPI003D03DEF0
MDLKEAGICGVVVIGGAIYGISEYGLSDVLTDDLKSVYDVPMTERHAYMTSVVDQFTEFYSGAIYGTDTYDFVGQLEYEIEPARATFVEVVESDIKIPLEEVKNIREYNTADWMCDHEDSRLFTDKGWTYVTELRNKGGLLMVTVTCSPPPNLLRS